MSRPDKLRMDHVNSLPQPFMVRFYGAPPDWWWPVWDIAVDVGWLRIDVIGKLEVREFCEVAEIRDADGGAHDPDDWYSDADEVTA